MTNRDEVAERKFKRDTLTLDQAMTALGLEWSGKPNIEFEPGIAHDYRIIRTQASDGTMSLTLSLLYEALEPLLYMRSCHRSRQEGPMPSGYKIGRIRYAAVFGMVDLKVGRYPGIRESFTIPVQVQYAAPANNQGSGKEC